MGTVKISGVDVVHPARNGLLQHGNRFLDISGRPHTNLSPSLPASCMAPYPTRFTVIEVPGSVKLPARFICSIISFLPMLFIPCLKRGAKNTLPPFLHSSSRAPQPFSHPPRNCGLLPPWNSWELHPARSRRRGSSRNTCLRSRPLERPRRPILKLRRLVPHSSSAKAACPRWRAAD